MHKKKYVNTKPSLEKRNNIFEGFKYLAEQNREASKPVTVIDNEIATVYIGRGQVLTGNLATLAGIDDDDEIDISNVPMSCEAIIPNAVRESLGLEAVNNDISDRRN